MSGARFPLVSASLAGFSGVGLGAFGAHGLEAHLEAAGRAGVWETAVLYHLIHSLVLLALGVWAIQARHAVSLIRRAAWLMLLGLLLFSGSLYALALDGPGWLGPVTPLGGVLLLLGWLTIALAAWREPLA